MNENQTFEEFLANQVPQISPIEFVINLIFTAIFAYILGRIYTRYGSSFSNKKLFASNFELIAVTTMIIITIVKSSLALSLGLVGALSIVRFRAAIKEPEELAYIFLTIAIGLGFGANQRLATFIGFIFLIGVIALKNYFKASDTYKNLNFTVSTEKPININSIIESISSFCEDVELKRLDENKKFMEASFLVEFKDFKTLSNVRKALYELDDSIQINFLDNKGSF